MAMPDNTTFLDRAFQNPYFHVGMGLLGGDNLGQGLSQGLLSYNSMQQNALAMEALRKKREQEAAQAAARERYIQTIPEAQRDLATAAPDQFFNAAAANAMPKPTTLQQNYQQAVQQGFKGSIFDYQAQLKRAGASNTTVNMPPLEKEYQKKRGGYFGEAANELDQAAMGASRNIENLNRLEQALANPNVYTGTAGEAVTGLKRAASSLGMDVEGVADAEVAQSVGNQIALELRNPSGGAGMPGALSDKDREFLQASVPGLTKTPAGNAMLIDFRKRIEQRKQDVASLARRYEQERGMLDSGFFDVLQRYSSQNPIITDQDVARAREIERRTPSRLPTVGTPLAPDEAQDLDSLLEKYR